jgi:transcriptional regulator with XRE-family HTH domain
MADDVLFSEWLNEIMVRKDITPAALAKASGLAPSTIHKLLNSKIKQPSLSSCKALSTALGVSGASVIRATGYPINPVSFPEQDDLNMMVALLPRKFRQLTLLIVNDMVDFCRKSTADDE